MHKVGPCGLSIKAECLVMLYACAWTIRDANENVIFEGHLKMLFFKVIQRIFCTCYLQSLQVFLGIFLF